MKHLGLGNRLKKFRESRDLSLDELASRAGLDEKALKAYELNQDYPEIAVLIKLAKALEINVADIFRERPSNKDYELLRKSERKRVSPLLQPSEAKLRDYVYEPLTLGNNDKHLDAYLIELAPRQGKRPHKDLTHPGEEFIYVLSGKFMGEIAGDQFELQEGDSLYFRSNISHKFYNPFDDRALAVAVVYPY